MRHFLLVTSALVAGAAGAHAAPVYSSSVTVPYGTTNSMTQSNTTAYTVKLGTDATNVYVDVVAANPAAAPTPVFANIYFGGPSITTGFGIESTNHRAFQTGGNGTYFELNGTGYTYAVGSSDIAFSLPLSFFETDPLGIGFTKYKTGDLLRISISQSYGYNFVGGNALPDPVNRLGSFIVPPLAVPEPASIALLGAGLVGLVGWRRRVG